MGAGMSARATWRHLPTAPVVQEFGHRVRQRRLELGLSLEQLARKMTEAAGCRVVIAPATLRAYETNERTPVLATVLFIAQCLDTTVTELLGEEPNDRGDTLAAAVQQVLSSYADGRLAQAPVSAPTPIRGRAS